MKDKDKDMIILDMNWTNAMRFMKHVPADVEKRSIAKFKEAYPKTNPTSNRPEGGLMSVEAMFAAKLMMTGEADESLLDGYYFKNKFLEQNKKLIEKFKK